MGTNYYWLPSVCEHCGRYDEHDRLHIGKSSAGWCFSLHAVPEKELLSWEEWEVFLAKGGSIVDEYGDKVALEKLRATVCERSHVEKWGSPPWGYSTWEVFHAQNHSLPGPNGLLRHRIESGHCLKHGDSTWDLISGEFS